MLEMKWKKALVFELEGKDSGLIIGRRGETLSSIEYLVRLIASKDVDENKCND